MISRKPRKGDLIESLKAGEWRSVGAVNRVEGNMCHMVNENYTFIWNFSDTKNKLHRIIGAEDEKR